MVFDASPFAEPAVLLFGKGMSSLSMNPFSSVDRGAIALCIPANMIVLGRSIARQRINDLVSHRMCALIEIAHPFLVFLFTKSKSRQTRARDQRLCSSGEKTPVSSNSKVFAHVTLSPFECYRRFIVRQENAFAGFGKGNATTYLNYIVFE